MTSEEEPALATAKPDAPDWFTENWLRVVTAALIVVLIGLTMSLPFWGSKGALDVYTWPDRQEKLVLSIPATEDAGAPDGTSEGLGSTSSLTQSDHIWHLKGRVLLDGSSLEGATVSAVSTDRLGNRFSPVPVMTDAEGSFSFEPIPLEPGDEGKANTADVRVEAKKCIPISSTYQEDKRCESADVQLARVSGEDTVTIGRRGSNRKIAISGLTILAIPVIFIISIVVAMVQVTTTEARKWQYYGSTLLAFFFSFTMLGYLMIGLARMSDIGSPGEIFTIGFLNVFHGSYASGGGDTWIVTLTSEANALEVAGEGPVVVPSGLGAPLWVILMSVIGSASYTILLLVGQIRSQIIFTDPEDIRQRVHQVAIHQFYVLVAPLGAVLVYQLLVIGEAASQDVTVATVALASGLGLNLLLDRARQTVEQLIGRTGQPLGGAPAVVERPTPQPDPAAEQPPE